MSDRPTVAIFRDLLLPMSETFIRAQGEALQNFIPHYFGSRRQPDIELPGGRVHVLHEGGVLGKAREALFKYFGYSPKLSRDLAATRPIVMHAHFGSGGALALPLAQRARLPLIVTFHGSDAALKDEWSKRSHYSQALYVRRRDELIVKGSLFLAVSKFVKSKLLAAGFPEEKVLVHYIGVDLQFFDLQRKSQNPDCVLFVGRLEMNKGCDYLIKAMSVVQKKFPSATLIILGDGPKRASLENLARETGCTARFLGTQNHESVRNWLSKAYVFSVPSVTEPSGMSEGFGLVSLEAQAMGVPVVSFQTGGIPEAVKDGVTGFLGAERDTEFLAKHIQLFFENADLRGRFSGAAVARVRDRFDLHKQTRLLEDIYLRVGNQHASNARSQHVYSS